MTPFTYLIKHVPTNRYYYGSRYSKDCHPKDLWSTYFTSSKRVKALIRKYGKKSFQFEIRKVFKTREQCINWERKVLFRLKVAYKKYFLNESNGVAPILAGKLNPNYKRSYTRKERKIMSDRSIKLWKDEKYKKKVRKNMSEAHKGNKHSEKTKRKMSLSRKKWFAKRGNLKRQCEAMKKRIFTKEHRNKILLARHLYFLKKWTNDLRNKQISSN